MLNVTCNDISVIYVTVHRCASRLKKKFDLRPGFQRHRHFVGFLNVPVQAPTRDQPLYTIYTVIPRNRPKIEFKLNFAVFAQFYSDGSAVYYTTMWMLVTTMRRANSQNPLELYLIVRNKGKKNPKFSYYKYV